MNAKGSLRTEVLDADRRPVEGFTLADCIPFTGDSTRARVNWKGNLASQSGKPVRLRFHLDEGDLYSFWISADERGSSGGYGAGGGPDFPEGRDSSAAHR